MEGSTFHKFYNAYFVATDALIDQSQIMADAIAFFINTNLQDFYITIDIPNIGKNFEEISSVRSHSHYIRPSSQFQMTDLIHPNPLIKLTNNNIAAHNQDGDINSNDGSSINVIDGKIYQTEWKKLVGTDLIFDEYGELIGKVNEHLVVNENVLFEGEDMEDEEEPEVSAHNLKSAFLNKAIKLASAKEKSN